VQSSVEAGCTNVQIAWPLECAILSALLERTATIAQAGVGSQTLRSGTVAFDHCITPSQTRKYLHQ